MAQLAIYEERSAVKIKSRAESRGSYTSSLAGSLRPLALGVGRSAFAFDFLHWF
jgi:hypothetical protein